MEKKINITKLVGSLGQRVNITLLNTLNCRHLEKRKITNKAMKTQLGLVKIVDSGVDLLTRNRGGT